MSSSTADEWTPAEREPAVMTMVYLADVTPNRPIRVSLTSHLAKGIIADFGTYMTEAEARDLRDSLTRALRDYKRGTW